MNSLVVFLGEYLIWLILPLFILVIFLSKTLLRKFRNNKNGTFLLVALVCWALFLGISFKFLRWSQFARDSEQMNAAGYNWVKQSEQLQGYYKKINRYHVYIRFSHGKNAGDSLQPLTYIDLFFLGKVNSLRLLSCQDVESKSISSNTLDVQLVNFEVADNGHPINKCFDPDIIKAIIRLPNRDHKFEGSKGFNNFVPGFKGKKFKLSLQRREIEKSKLESELNSLLTYLDVLVQ